MARNEIEKPFSNGMRSIPDAARWLGLSKASVYRIMDSGELLTGVNY